MNGKNIIVNNFYIYCTYNYMRVRSIKFRRCKQTIKTYKEKTSEKLMKNLSMNWVRLQTCRLQKCLCYVCYWDYQSSVHILLCSWNMLSVCCFKVTQTWLTPFKFQIVIKLQIFHCEKDLYWNLTLFWLCLCTFLTCCGVTTVTFKSFSES